MTQRTFPRGQLFHAQALHGSFSPYSWSPLPVVTSTQDSRRGRKSHGLTRSIPQPFSDGNSGCRPSWSSVCFLEPAVPGLPRKGAKRPLGDFVEKVERHDSTLQGCMCPGGAEGTAEARPEASGVSTRASAFHRASPRGGDHSGLRATEALFRWRE